MIFHRCPKCGYEPTPIATSQPEVFKECFGKNWCVAFWTNESDHRWMRSDFPTEEAARQFANTVKTELDIQDDE